MASAFDHSFFLKKLNRKKKWILHYILKEIKATKWYTGYQNIIILLNSYIMFSQFILSN